LVQVVEAAAGGFDGGADGVRFGEEGFYAGDDALLLREWRKRDTQFSYTLSI
jgi:hypothetical protein